LDACFVKAENYRLVGLPVGEHKATVSLTNHVTKQTTDK